jgi:hypothetical protein
VKKKKKWWKIKVRIPIGKPTRFHSERSYKRDKNKTWLKKEELFKKDML